MTFDRKRWVLSLSLLLLAGRPAFADNYTSRSGRQGASAGSTTAESVPVPEVPSPAAETGSLRENPALAETVPDPAGAEPAAAAQPALPEPAPAQEMHPASAPGVLPAASLAPPAGPGAPAGPAASKLEKVWLDGQLPEGAQTEGEWVWAADPAAGAAAVHSHPSRKGMQSHRFTAAEPMEMPGNGMIVQQVWLDPLDPPQGIALRFKLASGEEAGVYWEGEKEVFTPTEYEELWYYGMLPELGRWISLEILAEDLGFEDTRIAGVTFSTFDGRVLWGKTLLTEAPPLEGEEEEEETAPAPEIGAGYGVPGTDAPGS